MISSFTWWLDKLSVICCLHYKLKSCTAYADVQYVEPANPGQAGSFLISVLFFLAIDTVQVWWSQWHTERLRLRYWEPELLAKFLRWLEGWFGVQPWMESCANDSLSSAAGKRCNVGEYRPFVIYESIVKRLVRGVLPFFHRSKWALFEKKPQASISAVILWLVHWSVSMIPLMQFEISFLCWENRQKERLHDSFQSLWEWLKSPIVSEKHALRWLASDSYFLLQKTIVVSFFFSLFIFYGHNNFPFLKYGNLGKKDKKMHGMKKSLSCTIRYFSTRNIYIYIHTRIDIHKGWMMSWGPRIEIMSKPSSGPSGLHGEVSAEYAMCWWGCQ